MEDFEAIKPLIISYIDSIVDNKLRAAIRLYFDTHVEDGFYFSPVVDDINGFDFQRISGHHTLVCLRIADKVAGDLIRARFWTAETRDIFIAAILLHDTGDYDSTDNQFTAIFTPEARLRKLHVKEPCNSQEWFGPLVRAITLHRGRAVGLDPQDFPAYDIAYNVYKVWQTVANYIPAVREILI
jgi:hypothetical protein